MLASVIERPKTAQSKVTTDKRPKILIIDDDEVLSEVLSRRLHQQGFNALYADSGQSGLARARADQPSLILLDLRLPDADGFTICEQLADDLETCSIPVCNTIRNGTPRHPSPLPRGRMPLLPPKTIRPKRTIDHHPPSHPRR